MDNQKLNKAREYLVKSFMDCLHEDKLPWEKGWNSATTKHYNPITKTKYQGINSLILMMSSIQNHFNDPRWVTFNQASTKGWKVKKDSRGTPVEFWSVYDKINECNRSFSEYEFLVRSGERDEKDFRITSRVYTVFNGSQIDGIEPFIIEGCNKLDSIEMNSFIDKIKENLHVQYEECGDSAHYLPNQDRVVMPPRSVFKSQAEFDSTLLHELAHATGHATRLNRKLINAFGSKEYAVEELHAEMTAVFMKQYMDISTPEEHYKNHKAYIQDWCEVIEKDAKVLFDAIKEAKKIADYLIEKGNLVGGI